MKTEVPLDTVRAGLSAAISSQNILPSARQQAEKLLDRIASPVRVAVLGRAGCGKSQIVNILAGARLIRKTRHAPILEIAYNSVEQTVVSPNDISARILAGHALEARAAMNASHVRIETPAGPLRHFSLLEVTVEGSAEEQQEALNWAAERADILIWCTNAFTAEEQALWSTVPDALKDHGFLVLTKADELLRRGQLETLIAALEDVVAEEFHSLLPVASLQAVNALISGGEKAKAALAASGGHTLIETIRANVAQGRRADIDHALLFLDRFDPSRSDERPGEHEAPVQAAAAGEVPSNVARLHDVIAKPARAAVPGKEERGILIDACAALRARAAELARCHGNTAAEPYGMSLQLCLATTEELSDRFSAVSLAHPGLGAIQDDLGEAADMMLLFQLENSVEAAFDAATLLLQLRRDMEVLLAA
jgi:hypothetical protein